MPIANPLGIPSIFVSIKRALEVPDDFNDYDFNILLAINAALGDVSDLGIGPVGGFAINGPDEVWEQFIGIDPRYDAVKTLVYNKAKLIFDPPSSSHGLAAMQKQIEAQEWRINVRREAGDWRDGEMGESNTPPELVNDFDGGTP